MVGVGPVNVVTGCRTGMIGMGSMKARVGGLGVRNGGVVAAQAFPEAHWLSPFFKTR